MKKVILDIKSNYDALSKSEKRVADFMIEHPENIHLMYITEFAAACGVSEATVVRFTRKFGFEGFQQFKIVMAQEQHHTLSNEKITAGDTPYSIFQKICDDIYCSLEKTKKCLNEDALKRCCDAILAASDIVLLGLGNSAPVASDAAHKMFRLGLRAHAYTDNHMQAIAAENATEKTVVIAFSRSGEVRDILEAMATARHNGAFTVAVTKFGGSTIESYSDAVLHTALDETNHHILGLNSRIAQLAIIDAIYSYLICHLENAQERIEKTENALQAKKYVKATKKAKKTR